jgi:hypothetical protein
MKTGKYFHIAACLTISACANYEWAATASDGINLTEARAFCAAQARERVRDERYFGDAYEPGPAGFPPDSPRDLEYRETEMCLRGKGFKKVRMAQ